MTSTKTYILIIFAILFALAGCNLANPRGLEKTGLAVLKIRANAAADYRSGPGPAYPLLGVLQAGHEVEAVGRSPDGQYLLVRDPANPAVFGWLSGALVTVTGDPLGLPTLVAPPAPSLVPGSAAGGCPTPVGGGPTPISCSASSGGPTVVGGCPTPVGGGPTPVTCSASGGTPLVICPSPVGGGPTPVTCFGSSVGPTLVGGCPTPVGGGPTPVTCSALPQIAGGCPTPIGGGPTPVSCSGQGGSPGGTGCPTPVGGGPTPVSCSGSSGGSPSVVGCPSPVGGGPTPVSCFGSSGGSSAGGPATPVPGSKPRRQPTPVGGSGSVPTLVEGPTPVPTPVR